jgi:hypothetical protein
MATSPFRERAIIAEFAGEACCRHSGQQRGAHESRAHQSTSQNGTPAGQSYERLHEVHDIPLSDEIESCELLGGRANTIVHAVHLARVLFRSSSTVDQTV